MKKFICLFALTVLFITGCIPPRPTSTGVPNPAYWPTQGWLRSSPEAQGMDSALLANMIEDAQQKEINLYSVIVIRNGYVVTEAYFHPYARDTRVHIQSVTKSVIGLLVGRAIQLGKIKNVEEPLLNFFPNRVIANLTPEKSAIRLSHLLSMTSGLDCQEFSANSPKMENSSGWVQFMLDQPMRDAPGKKFNYCNGNAHLLSAILEKTTGMPVREFANLELFAPLGIPQVEEADWSADPQGYNTGGYGLHLRPVDLAKLALLSLQNGKWEGNQLLPDDWVIASTTQHIQKEDSAGGYGYLWTVYPDQDHYAALGLGGQQIHVYPSKNLIVVVTAGLRAYVEAPEIEAMLNANIMPAIQSTQPLTESAEKAARLKTAIAQAENPVHPVPTMPAIAAQVNGKIYAFDQNPAGWQTLQFDFLSTTDSATITLNSNFQLPVGLDHLYRRRFYPEMGEVLLRGEWTGERTFVVDYPYGLSGPARLGELGDTKILYEFHENIVGVTIEPQVFGEPISFMGTLLSGNVK